MADPLPPELLEALTGLGKGFKDLQQKNIELISSYRRGMTDFDKYDRALKDVTKSMKFLGGDPIAKFTRGIKSSFEGLDEFSETIRALDGAIAAAGESGEAAAMAAQREVMARKAATVAYTAASTELIRTLTKTVTVGFVSTAGQFVKGLQNNQSATELSTGLMSGALDMATSAASSAGQGIAKVGDTAMTLAKPGSKLQLLGAAASLAGSAISSMAEGFSKLAKFGLDVLSKELEKTVSAYNSMNRSGAMFADGMTGMVNTATKAGLTLDQFSKVVTENASTLAESGMGVSGAVQKLGAVTNQINTSVGSSGKTLRREMLELGYSFEEQAGLVAEVMGDMRRARSSQMGDDKAIAQQTAEYASNLRLVASITGEDAKRKMAEQREAATQVAFRLKLQELEKKQPGVTNKILTAMQTLDPAARKAAMQQMTLGVVTDKAASIMMAGSEGFSDKVTGFANLAESGGFEVEKSLQMQAAANEKAARDMPNFLEIGMAGQAGIGGVISDVNSAVSGLVTNTDKITQDAVQGSVDALRMQKIANDKLTEGVMGAAEEAQKLKIALQNELLPAISNFAQVSKEILEGVRKMMVSSGMATESLWEKTKRIVGAGIEMGSIGATAGAAIGKVAGAVTGGAAGAVGGAGVGAAPGAAAGGLIGSLGGTGIGAIGGFLVGAVKEAIWGRPGMALGGISEGPTSGYLEKLHGTEAIIPLSGGRTVPVSMEFSNFGKTISDMSASTLREAKELYAGKDDDKGKTSGLLASFGEITKGFTSGIDKLVQPIGTALSGTFGGQMTGGGISNVLSDLSKTISGFVGVEKLTSGPSADLRLGPVTSTISSIANTLGDIVTGAGSSLRDTVGKVTGTAGGESDIRALTNKMQQQSAEQTERQVRILSEILDVLSSSNQLQQQYVNNTAA